MNTAIWLADPHGTTLIILDNLGWYCEVDKHIHSLTTQGIIIIKIEESLNFVVKIKL
jgi:hypothetical protein